MASISHKHCVLAIGLQADKDTEAAGTLVKIPLPEGCTPPTLKQNYNIFQYGGGNYGQTHYETSGAAVEGTIKFPLVPGHVGTGASYPLGRWMWGRGLEAAYYEGYYATVYVDRGNTLIEKYVGVKVKSGTISVDYGANYAAVEVEVEGIKVPEAGSFSDPDFDLWELQAYRYCEAAISLGGNTDNWTRNHSLKFDNRVERIEALNGLTTPHALPNGEKTQWSVSFDRHFYNTTIYDDYVAGNEIAYSLVLARSGVATATFSMPRCIITEHGLPIPDSGLMQESGVTLQALAAADGTADACTPAETVT